MRKRFAALALCLCLLGAGLLPVRAAESPVNVRDDSVARRVPVGRLVTLRGSE